MRKISYILPLAIGFCLLLDGCKPRRSKSGLQSEGASIRDVENDVSKVQAVRYMSAMHAIHANDDPAYAEMNAIAKFYDDPKDADESMVKFDAYEFLIEEMLQTDYPLLDDPQVTDNSQADERNFSFEAAAQVASNQIAYILNEKLKIPDLETFACVVSAERYKPRRCGDVRSCATLMEQLGKLVTDPKNYQNLYKKEGLYQSLKRAIEETKDDLACIAGDTADLYNFVGRSLSAQADFYYNVEFVDTEAKKNNGLAATFALKEPISREGREKIQAIKNQMNDLVVFAEKNLLDPRDPLKLSAPLIQGLQLEKYLGKLGPEFVDLEMKPSTLAGFAGGVGTQLLIKASELKHTDLRADIDKIVFNIIKAHVLNRSALAYVDRVGVRDIAPWLADLQNKANTWERETGGGQIISANPGTANISKKLLFNMLITYCDHELNLPFREDYFRLMEFAVDPADGGDVELLEMKRQVLEGVKASYADMALRLPKLAPLINYEKDLVRKFSDFHSIADEYFRFEPAALAEQASTRNFEASRKKVQDDPNLKPWEKVERWEEMARQHTERISDALREDIALSCRAYAVGIQTNLQSIPFKTFHDSCSWFVTDHNWLNELKTISDTNDLGRICRISRNADNQNLRAFRSVFVKVSLQAQLNERCAQDWETYKSQAKDQIIASVIMMPVAGLAQGAAVLGVRRLIATRVVQGLQIGEKFSAVGSGFYSVGGRVVSGASNLASKFRTPEFMRTIWNSRTPSVVEQLAGAGMLSIGKTVLIASGQGIGWAGKKILWPVAKAFASGLAGSIFFDVFMRAYGMLHGQKFIDPDRGGWNEFYFSVISGGITFGMLPAVHASARWANKQIFQRLPQKYAKYTLPPFLTDVFAMNTFFTGDIFLKHKIKEAIGIPEPPQSNFEILSMAFSTPWAMTFGFKYVNTRVSKLVEPFARAGMNREGRHDLTKQYLQSLIHMKTEFWMTNKDGSIRKEFKESELYQTFNAIDSATKARLGKKYEAAYILNPEGYENFRKLPQDRQDEVRRINNLMFINPFQVFFKTRLGGRIGSDLKSEGYMQKSHDEFLKILGKRKEELHKHYDDIILKMESEIKTLTPASDGSSDVAITNFQGEWIPVWKVQVEMRQNAINGAKGMKGAVDRNFDILSNESLKHQAHQYGLFEYELERTANRVQDEFRYDQQQPMLGR